MDARFWLGGTAEPIAENRAFGFAMAARTE